MKTVFGAPIHEIRISGGLLGLEFESSATCKAVFDALLEAEEGLLTKWGGRNYKTLIFWFALNMSGEQLQHINELILAALHKVLATKHADKEANCQGTLASY